MCVSLQLYSLDAFFKHITLLLVMIRLYFHIFHRNISDAAIYQEFNFLVHSHGGGICFVEYLEAMSKKFQVGIFKHFLIILKCFELVFLNNHYKDSHFKKIFAKYYIILITSDQNGFKIPPQNRFYLPDRCYPFAIFLARTNSVCHFIFQQQRGHYKTVNQTFDIVGCYKVCVVVHEKLKQNIFWCYR